MSDEEEVYSDSESEQSEIKNKEIDDEIEDENKNDDADNSDDEENDSDDGDNNDIKFEFNEEDENDIPEDSDDAEYDTSDEEDNIEESDEDDEKPKQKKNIVAKKSKKQLITLNEEEEDEEEDELNENYLEKFDADLVKNYINEFHPECLQHNYDEIAKFSVVIRNSDGIIVDPLHKTIPYLTKYEKARILGQRSKQIETGAKPFVKVPENIIDSYIIAELELKAKKIPFIIKRPIPNGGCEYWNLKDLEVISF
jgi:DNA-directed RNA polymerase subunit K/omega